VSRKGCGEWGIWRFWRLQVCALPAFAGQCPAHTVNAHPSAITVNAHPSAITVNASPLANAVNARPLAYAVNAPPMAYAVNACPLAITVNACPLAVAGLHSPLQTFSLLTQLALTRGLQVKETVEQQQMNNSSMLAHSRQITGLEKQLKEVETVQQQALLQYSSAAVDSNSQVCACRQPVRLCTQSPAHIHLCMHGRAHSHAPCLLSKRMHAFSWEGMQT